MTNGATPPQRWRGYINQLTHGWDMTGRVDDAAIDRLADELIREQLFRSPVKAYYDAAVEALRSGERLALLENERERPIRDLLERLVVALDARKPWPDPPYREMDADRWWMLRDAPVIGVLPFVAVRIEFHLHRMFVPVDGDDATKALLLRLRSGHETALVAPPSIREPRTTVRSHDDAPATIAAFAELTGLQIVPEGGPEATANRSEGQC